MAKPPKLHTPLIGLTCSLGRAKDWDRATWLPQHRMNANYADAVRLAGGQPVILGAAFPDSEGSLEGMAEDLMGRLDGLLLTGGGDITEYQAKPAGKPDEYVLLDKFRDDWEMALLRGAEKAGAPILGICRGLQVMNHYFGGTLYHDIPSEVPGAIRHTQDSPRTVAAHAVDFEKGSKISEIFGALSLRVNTGHHQAQKDPGKNFVVAGRASDGVIEAMEHTSLPFALGVQWHPEGLVRAQKESLGLFKAFVGEARKARGQSFSGGGAKSG